jgi:hypothetical protein
MFTGDSNILKTVKTVTEATQWKPATATGSYDEWINAENALLNDSSYAYATQSGAAYKWQSYHTFGFDIPTDATILGIEISYRHYESSVDPLDGGFSFNMVKPNGSDQQKESALVSSMTTSTLGSSSDTWSFPSITPEEINSDDFRIDVGVYSYSGKIITANLYYIMVQVTYIRDLWFSGDAHLAEIKGPYEFTGDASLIETLSGQFTGEANLLRNLQTQFTGDASIIDTDISAQFTGDASLKSVEELQFTGDSFIHSVYEETFSGDANLDKTVTRSFTGNAIIKTLHENTFSGDSCLYDNDSKFLYGSWIYGTLYGGVIGADAYSRESFTGDANLAVMKDGQFVSDSSLLKIAIESYTGDANLERLSVLSTFTGDAEFAETIYGSFTGDSSLRGLEINTFTSDSYLTHPYFTGDSNLAIIVINSFLGDSALVNTYTGTFTGDTSFIKERADTFTGDADLLKINITSQFTGDASLKSTEANQFTGDAIIKTLVKGTFTGDSNLLRTDYTSTFDSDSSLLIIISDTFTSDANLKGSEITQFTGDSSLLSIEKNQFKSDAFFSVEKVDTFAGTITLEYIGTAGFAGTCDCISMARTGWGLSNMEEFGLQLGI